MRMAMWGLFVAAALVIGSLPFLFGLAVVLAHTRAFDMASVSQDCGELSAKIME
jgi:heme/copper-type cytochrome/quinol oxidase subunit 1